VEQQRAGRGGAVRRGRGGGEPVGVGGRGDGVTRREGEISAAHLIELGSASEVGPLVLRGICVCWHKALHSSMIDSVMPPLHTDN
jgi:hypothetical protein